MSTQRTRFPSTFSGFDLDLLLRSYAVAPEKVSEVIDGLGQEGLTATPRSGKWSIHEIILHLADSEIMGAARIRQTLAQSGPEFSYYNQDRWADALRYLPYDGRRFEGALELFASLRSTTLPLLTGASSADWTKMGIHAEMGPVTLRQLLELYADHGERHLAQILEIRALLGDPVECELLLPARLY